MTLSVKFGSVQNAVAEYFEHAEIIKDFKCSGKSATKCVKEECRRNLSFYTYPKVLRIVMSR